MTTTNPPRITQADVDAAIASEHVFTAHQGALKAWEESDSGPREYDPPHGLASLTCCVLVLRNGTKILGVNYGSIDPELHDSAMGQREARADAVRQVWPLLGYVLREKLHAQAGDYRDRVRAEAADLKERMNRLYAFTLLPAFDALAAPDRELMVQQGMAMAGLVAILESRIARF